MQKALLKESLHIVKKRSGVNYPVHIRDDSKLVLPMLLSNKISLLNTYLTSMARKKRI